MCSNKRPMTGEHDSASKDGKNANLPSELGKRRYSRGTLVLIYWYAVKSTQAEARPKEYAEK